MLAGERTLARPAGANQDNQTELEKADVALKKTQAMGTFVTTGCDALVSPKDWWMETMGKTEEEADQLISGAIGVQAVVDREAPPNTSPVPKAGDKGSSMKAP